MNSHLFYPSVFTHSSSGILNIYKLFASLSILYLFYLHNISGSGKSFGFVTLNSSLNNIGS